ncbi:MAG: hypothetical protein ACYCPQ_08020 [Elusimicrobiota bacterium]
MSITLGHERAGMPQEALERRKVVGFHDEVADVALLPVFVCI